MRIDSSTRAIKRGSQRSRGWHGTLRLIVTGHGVDDGLEPWEVTRRFARASQLVWRLFWLTGIRSVEAEDNMSNWRDRLPEGVECQDKVPDGFTLTVAMPTGDDGLLPLVCPVAPDHRFKVRVIQSSDESPGVGLHARSDGACPRGRSRVRRAIPSATLQRHIWGRGPRILWVLEHGHLVVVQTGDTTTYPITAGV